MDKIDVVAAIIIKDDKFFIAQRNRNKHMGLSWESPGGKVEDGETFEVAELVAWLLSDKGREEITC